MLRTISDSLSRKHAKCRAAFGELRTTWETNIETRATRLNGWKSIGRHLGKSERAAQLWEVERGLPVHRIPGTKGWTVFAYVEELDDWRSRHATTVHLAASAGRSSGGRAHGLLVLPFVARRTTGDSDLGDAIAEATIVHCASRLPALRVASWATARGFGSALPAVTAIARDHQVRYLVEGMIDVDDGELCVRVHVVDAEVDCVLLTNRLIARLDARSNAVATVAHAIAEHIALLLDGAIVEPKLVDAVEADAFLLYLDGIRRLEAGSGGIDPGASCSFDRCVALAPHFVAAHGMRGLSLVQRARSEPTIAEGCIAQARAIASRCEDDRASALVTSAFLEAAIAMQCEHDRTKRDRALWKSLRALSQSSGLGARLIERRTGPRGDTGCTTRPNGSDTRRADDGMTHALRADASPTPAANVVGSLIALLSALRVDAVARDPDARQALARIARRPSDSTTTG